MNSAPVSTAAGRARELHRLAAVGSNRRRAAAIAAVLLDNSRSMEAARRLLGRHRIPAELKASVLDVLAELESADGDC